MKNNVLQSYKDDIRQSIKVSSALSIETNELLTKKNGDFNGQLKKCNKLKDSFIENYRVVLSEYNAQIDNDVPEKELRKLYTYAEGLRVHINLQQDNCNQLNYQIQRKQYQYSMIVAGVALFITLVFSLLAFFGINYSREKTDPAKNECQQDSTKKMNIKLQQPNFLYTIPEPFAVKDME
jgi:hypothetical protein